VEYKVEACVSIAGSVELADVRATLKLENAGGNVNYITLARYLCPLLPNITNHCEEDGIML
jgi:hypothetical protein